MITSPSIDLANKRVEIEYTQGTFYFYHIVRVFFGTPNRIPPSALFE